MGVSSDSSRGSFGHRRRVQLPGSSSVAARILQLALQVVTYGTYVLICLQRCICHALGSGGFTAKRTEHDDLARACALMMHVASASTHWQWPSAQGEQPGCTSVLRAYERTYVRYVRTYAFQQVRTYALPHSWGLCERCRQRKRGAPSTCARTSVRRHATVVAGVLWLGSACVRARVLPPPSVAFSALARELRTYVRAYVRPSGFAPIAAAPSQAWPIPPSPTPPPIRLMSCG